MACAFWGIEIFAFGSFRGTKHTVKQLQVVMARVRRIE
jgi:hypothetical protein